MCRARAWCKVGNYENWLADHLFTSLKVTLELEKLNKSLYISSKKASNFFDKQNRDKIQIIALTSSLYSIIAHDFGKACSKFQSTVYADDKNQCHANFRFHEIISGAIVYEFVKRNINEIIEIEVPQEDQLKSFIYSTIIYPVISHHQAMKGRGIEVIDRDPRIEAESLAKECGELQIDKIKTEIDDLKNRIERLIENEQPFKEPLQKAVKWLEITKGSVDNVSDKSIKELISYLRGEGVSQEKRLTAALPLLRQHTYVTTGVLMIADDLAALCERRNSQPSRFIERIWSELSNDEKKEEELCNRLGIHINS